jgi:predicted DsbA family dithiol-disulfide isomerase
MSTSHATKFAANPFTNPEPAAMPNITIDIISDPVCIWCYMGYNRLQRATELFAKTHPAGRTRSFIIKWHPFYLNPNTKVGESITKREAMEQKFGVEGVPQAIEKLKRLGLREGIKFDVDGRIGSTRDAHRLLYFAESHGTQDILDRVAVGLFKGHFEQGEDITDRTWLTKVGSEAGLDETQLRGWLNSNEGGVEVDMAARQNRDLTSGVPKFTIQEKYILDGAKDTDEFFSTFLRVAEEEESA